MAATKERLPKALRTGEATGSHPNCRANPLRAVTVETIPRQNERAKKKSAQNR